MTELLDKLVETLLEIMEKKVDAKLFDEDWVKPFIKEVEQVKLRIIQEKCIHEYEWHHVEVGIEEDMQSICVCKNCGHHC
jgi:hypothetical protein